MRKTYPTLSAYLAATGTTQADFAEQVGTTQQHISRIACGVVAPSYDLALRIARAARVPMESFASSCTQDAPAAR